MIIMKNRCISCAIALGKQLYRSVAFRVTAFVIFLSTLGLFMLFSKDHDYIGMLQLSHFSVIALMLMFLLFGAKLGGLERDHSCAELLQTYPCKKAVAATGHMLVGILIPFVFSAVILAEVLILYATMGTSAPLAQYAVSYVILYYLFPCVSCLLLGIGIGNIVSGRWKYALLVLIFLFTSPISPEIFAYIFEALHTRNERLHYFFAMLSLSRTRSLEISPLYGHSIESARYLAATIRLALISVFTFSVCQAPSKTARMSAVIMVSCIALCAIQMTNTEKNRSLFLYGNAQDLSSYSYDVDYYNNIEMGVTDYPDIEPTEFFKTDAVDIAIIPDMTGITANCIMTLTNTRESQYQAFTLYRNLAVRSVKLDNEEVHFEQTGDYITVDMGQIINEGNTIMLEFAYSGSTSPSFPANDSNIRLAGSFPWIPTVGAVLPTRDTVYMDVLTIPLMVVPANDTQIEYTLHYNSMEGPLFTNLSKTSSDKWSGLSNQGVTIIADPMLVHDEVDGILFSYPATVEKEKNAIVTQMKHYVNTAAKLREMIGAPVWEPIQHLALLPVPHWLSGDASDIGIYYGNGVYGLYIESVYRLGLYTDEELLLEGSAFATAIQKSIVLQPQFLRSFEKQPEYRLFAAAFCDQITNSITAQNSAQRKRTFELEFTFDSLTSHVETVEEESRITELYQLLHMLVSRTTLEEAAPVWRIWYMQNMGSDALDINKLANSVKEVLAND